MEAGAVGAVATADAAGAVGAVDAAGAVDAVDAETMQEWRARRPAPR